MTWHYQLMRHTEPSGDVWFAIHEFYEGRIGWTKDPTAIGGTSEDTVKWQLKRMLEDIEKHGVKDYD